MVPAVEDAGTLLSGFEQTEVKPLPSGHGVPDLDGHAVDIE